MCDRIQDDKYDHIFNQANGMVNIFHLIVKTRDLDDSKISRTFANLFICYAKAFNKTYNRSGSLFKKPFNFKLIESDTYLINVILYLHCNPIKDGFVKDLVSYLWTSYLKILDTTKTFLQRDFVLDLFNDKTNYKTAHKHYLKNPSFTPTFDNL